MSEKLLPCPACGGDTAVQGRSDAVRCDNRLCMLDGPFPDPDGARWNALPRRTDAKATAGMGDAELIARAILGHAMATSQAPTVAAIEGCFLDTVAELARREKERQT